MGLWLWLASQINKKTLVTLVNIYLTLKKNYVEVSKPDDKKSKKTEAPQPGGFKKVETSEVWDMDKTVATFFLTTLGEVMALRNSATHKLSDGRLRRQTSNVG